MYSVFVLSQFFKIIPNPPQSNKIQQGEANKMR